MLHAHGAHPGNNLRCIHQGEANPERGNPFPGLPHRLPPRLRPSLHSCSIAPSREFR